MTSDDLGPRSGWYVDPVGPLGRRRWWAEGAWTARVAGPEDEDSIAWRPDLADAPPPPVAPPMPSAPEAPAAPADSLAPIRWFAPGYEPLRLAVAPPEPEPEPVIEAVDEQLEPVVELPTAAPRSVTSRRRRVGAALVAAALLAVAAGAGGAIFGNSGRPELAPVSSYRDADAGFALRYPDEWRVDSETPGRSIRFSIGDAEASAFATNNVSVVIGDDADELPALEQAANDVTGRLQEDFPGIRLEAAENSELVGGPALRLRFADVSERPPIQLEQLLGRTTAGKLLAVTITIRDPRTAPTSSELREFLDSITSL